MCESHYQRWLFAHPELKQRGPNEVITPKGVCLVWGCGKALNPQSEGRPRGSNGMCWDHYLEVVAEDIPDKHRCSEPGCRTVTRATDGHQLFGMRGMCWTHYDDIRLRGKGGGLAPLDRSKPLCACGKPSAWKGKCRSCYDAARRQAPETRERILEIGREHQRRYRASQLATREDHALAA